MRNGKLLLTALLGAAFVLGGAGGAFAYDQQGEHVKTERNQAPPKTPVMDSGMRTADMATQPGAPDEKKGHGKMMGQGMTGQGMTGQGMAGQGMMGKMMGQGMMGQGMMNMREGGFPKLLSAADVKAMLSHWLSKHIGERVKVGAIEELGIFAFGVDITTVDGSLVQRLAVDRRGNGIWRID